MCRKPHEDTPEKLGKTNLNEAGHNTLVESYVYSKDICRKLDTNTPKESSIKHTFREQDKRVLLLPLFLTAMIEQNFH